MQCKEGFEGQWFFWLQQTVECACPDEKILSSRIYVNCENILAVKKAAT